MKDLIEKLKNENFRNANQINTQIIEKQDFLQQIKLKDENIALLKEKILEYENCQMLIKQKEDYFKKTLEECNKKEYEKFKIIQEKNALIETLKIEISELNKLLKEKENIIISKVDEINVLCELRSNYENKIVQYANEFQREKDNNRELVLKSEVLNSDFNLKMQLSMNQINHLNENINQLNNELKLNKEKNLFKLHSIEKKISEITLERDLFKSQVEVLNNQILTLKKTLNLKESEFEERNIYTENLQKNITKLNADIQLYSEIITEKDLEISKIYKYKERFDKYTYIENNLDIFNIVNAADLNTLQEEFKKLYSIHKENKTQLDNLKSINESLRKDSQEVSILKENCSKIEKELQECSKKLIEKQMLFCDLQRKNEELNLELIFLKELKNRISEQNKKLLFEAKILNSGFNLLNTGLEKNKQDYERFLYSSIEDLEAKNCELHYENLQLKNFLANTKQQKDKIFEEITKKESIIKEQKGYIENLEQNIKEINEKINSVSYYRQCGFGGYGLGGIPRSISDQNKTFMNEELNNLNVTINKNKILIEDLEAKVDYYEKHICENNKYISANAQEILTLKNENHQLIGDVSNYKNLIDSLNFKISNLENQAMIKDNYINAINFEKQDLKNSFENLRRQKDFIFEEISHNSKETINKLNENKKIFLDQIEKLSNENSSMKKYIDIFSENISTLLSNKEIKNAENPPININQKDLDDNEILINQSEKIFSNLFNYSNLFGLLNEKEKELLFILPNEELIDNISFIKNKFYIIKKLLLLADKSINESRDSKIKIDNLNSIITNLRFENQVYQGRISHLEIMIKNLTEKSVDKYITKCINESEDNKNLMNLDLKFQENKTDNNKPHFKVVNTSILTSSSMATKEVSDENLRNVTTIPAQEIYPNIFNEYSQYLEKYFELIRQNDNFRIANMELNSTINEIKKQNQELINNKFNNQLSIGNNSSKFFFDKYNELLLEKINLEKSIAEDKSIIENLHIQIDKLEKELAKSSIEKKDLEMMYSELEKKLNEEYLKNVKNQEKFLKQIDELNVSVQNLSKDKANFTNVFNKLKTDKFNLENINKNNLTEITNLKENIIHKDEYINTIKNQIENLNQKLAEKPQIRPEENKKKSNADNSKYVHLISKLISILNKSRSLIEVFVQLKIVLENKIKNLETLPSGNTIDLKIGEIFDVNNIFNNSLNEINQKMLKYDQEIKLNKKKEESLEKKISALNNEINLLQMKEKMFVNELKILKDKSPTDIEGDKNKEIPVLTDQNQTIKNYFNKSIKNLTTAKNLITFKDYNIKKLESEITTLTNKLNNGMYYIMFK